jgi:pimeloyl-ACP methyl ester carboxylesterase
LTSSEPDAAPDCPSTGEQLVEANGITLSYEVLGDPASPPLVLITGLGMQMVHWPMDFCAGLVDHGFSVIRFDNRDTGRSTKIEDGPSPNIAAGYAGYTESASYNLRDMADDVAGLLDALGLDAAHILGVSLGGTVAQTLAIAHPERVLSLISVMSTTGQRRGGLPDPRVLALFMRRPRNDKAAYVDHVVKMFRAGASPAYPFQEAEHRAMLELAVDRCYHPRAAPRQMLAMLDSGDRTRDLRRLQLPTLVVHGRQDVMMPVSGGRATARAIPGAAYLELDGMGHDLPRPLWPMIMHAVVGLTTRAAAGPPPRGSAARHRHRQRGRTGRQASASPRNVGRAALKTTAAMVEMEAKVALWAGTRPLTVMQRLAHQLEDLVPGDSARAGRSKGREAR